MWLYFSCLHAQHFLPVYLEASRKAYSLANIESAFRVTGIVRLDSRILTKPQVEAQEELDSIFLEKTPYAKLANECCPCLY